MVNAFISTFLPPCHQANFLYLTPQSLRTTKSRVPDLLGMHWAAAAAAAAVLFIYPDPRTDKHPIDTFPQQQSLSWMSCSPPRRWSQKLQGSLSPFPKGHFPLLGSRRGILCPFFWILDYKQGPFQLLIAATVLKVCVMLNQHQTIQI